MSIRAAAKKFSITKSVIFDHLKGLKSNKIGRKPVLNPEVEREIVQNLIVCAEWGYPLDTLDLRSIVQSNYCIIIAQWSTHLTQPLDVSFFTPLKAAWRKVLTKWKSNEGRDATCLDKNRFPGLLSKLVIELHSHSEQIIISGFKKTGIHPFDRFKVLDRLPPDNAQEDQEDLSNDVNVSFVDILRILRPTATESKTKKKHV